MPEERLTYTVPEVARLLGVSRGVAYESVRCGEIPGVIRLGRRVLVSRHALMSLLNANELAANEPVGKKPEATGHAAPPILGPSATSPPPPTSSPSGRSARPTGSNVAPTRH